MKIFNRKRIYLLTALCGVLACTISSAQTYLRYVKPEDLGSKALYADSVLTAIRLPKGVASLSNYPKFNLAALELMQIMNDPTKEVMQIYVCGSASPDGLWADNVRLSQARTDAAAKYLTEILDIPSYMIHSQSLDEDWDRLYELVAESDLPYKYSVMSIIKSMDWGERKKALQNLDDGRVWRILSEEFFPKLRCVRFAVFCKWDKDKPYMSKPVQPVVEPVVAPQPVPIAASKVDTVYVRDTVYMVKEIVYVPQSQSQTATPYETYRENNIRKSRKEWDTPWMMGFKTNLLADAMAIPMGGVEFQLADKVSLDISGWYSNVNMFVPSDETTNFYGFSPELRLWFTGDTMRKGSFIGLHGRCAWYTMQWRDGYLYQNGPEDVWEGNYHNAGNNDPAWSAGLTYGYSLGLGRKANWGLEFLIGIGYARYTQNTAQMNEGIWELVEFQDRHHVGITRLGINLTYRFSLRKVNPDYYEN